MSEKNWATNLTISILVERINKLEKKKMKKDDCMQNIIHRPNTERETITTILFFICLQF